MARIWFGNPYRAGYVAAPLTGLEASGVGYVSATQLQSGGAFVTGSTASHREFPMEWSVKSVAELQFLSSYFTGIYGNEYLYWVDPFAENVLPPHWAAPMLTLNDWPSLISPSRKPNPAPTPINSQGYPMLGATYSPSGAVDTVPERQLTLLIPDDSHLHIGFIGESDGAVIRIEPVLRDGSVEGYRDLEMLSVTSNATFEQSFSGHDYKLVRIYMTPTRVGGSVTIFAGQAIYTKTGIPPFQQSFTPGTGHTGMMFSEAPAVTYVQALAGRRLVSASASFTEVEAWQ